MMKSIDVDRGIERVKQEPLKYAFLAVAVIAMICLFTHIFEIELPIPEFHRAEAPEAKVVDLGDSFVWLGMRVVPFNRSLRREFIVPKKVKGMYVVNAGKGLAMSRGVQTGDILCGINRSTFNSRRSLLKVVKNTKYFEGILMDIFRDGENMYITIPYEYSHGPLFGPNKDHWQLGSPIFNQAFRYGEMIQPAPVKTTKNR
jgi:hypothetical protein